MVHDAKTYEWLRGIEICEADARAYAGAIHGAGMRSLSALLDASPGADALGKLRLKKGHVSLVRSEIAAARFAALAPPAAALSAVNSHRDDRARARQPRLGPRALRFLRLRAGG